VTGRGPSPDDPHFAPALKQADRRAAIEVLLADAGYDSESAHELAREVYGMCTIIPPTRGRPRKDGKPPGGRWRQRMAACCKDKKYGQRWQVETVVSMIKRRLGSALRARRYWSQSREITLREITLNVMILYCVYWSFLQSKPDPFSSSKKVLSTRRAPTRPLDFEKARPSWHTLLRLPDQTQLSRPQ